MIRRITKEAKGEAMPEERDHPSRDDVYDFT
jgi:hypothetical protein